MFKYYRKFIWEVMNNAVEDLLGEDFDSNNETDKEAMTSLARACGRGYLCCLMERNIISDKASTKLWKYIDNFQA